jgi:CHAT domain-containing protein/tetratricopeptide (TPR) repeat protein
MSALDEIIHLEEEALTAQAGHRYREAIQGHGRALILARSLDRPRLMAVLFNRLGAALEADGQIQDAVIAYETGLKALAAEAGLDIEGVLVSLGAIGKGFGGSGELAAPDLYQASAAQDLAVAEADLALPVRLLINIGNAYLRQPEEEPAMNAYQEALQRPELAVAPELRGHVLTGIAVVYQWRGEREMAKATLDEALSLLEAHAAPVERQRALAVRAGLHREQGQTERALESYQAALGLYARVDEPHGEGRTWVGFGRLLLEAQRYAEAGEAFQRGAELAQRVHDQDTLWYASWGLGRCQHWAGDMDQAVASFRRSLDLIWGRQRELRTDEGKVAFLESVLETFDDLIAVHLERAQADASSYAEALVVAEDARGRALLDLMDGHGRRQLPDAQHIRSSRVRPFHERVTVRLNQEAGNTSLARDSHNLAAQMAPGIGSPSGGLPDIVLQMAARTESGSRRSSAEAVPPEAGDGSSLPPLARLVFYTLPDCTAVFAVTPGGGVHGHVAPLGREAIGERVTQARRALQVDDAPRGMRALFWGEQPQLPQESLVHEPLLQDLYAQLIEPLADLLPTDGTPLVIEPHGPLWLLPFAALRAADGSWLAEQWPLLYTPSAQALEEIRHARDYGVPADLKALIVGDPTMPQVHLESGLSLELDALPGSAQEARAIASLFNPERCTLLLGAKADRARVESLAPQIGILHLATHGVAYAEDPLASFVALAEPADGDGLLTARRVISLSLPADLVTLSACQTGLGKVGGEGIIGLSRAFLVAGARAVLVSQWSVDDEATAALMTAFYRGYLELDDKALALQRAMRELRSQPGYDHPRYWAPFLVVGAEA